MSTSTRPPLASRYASFLRRHAAAILAISIAMFGGSAYLTSKLKLKTAFTELLPSDDEGIQTLLKTEARMGGLSLLLVGVHSPDRSANLAYAELLTQRFRALPKSQVELATYHLRDLKSFFLDNKWLYLKEDDLRDVRDRLKSEIAKRKNPLLVDLGSDEPIEGLRSRIAKQDKLGGKFPDGVFTDADGKYVWVAVLPPGGIFVEGSNEKILHFAQNLIREEDPHKFHPQMEAEIAGPIASAVSSRQAVEQDVISVTAICVVLVLTSIALYFRRFRALPLIGFPAIVGTLMAFALAKLTTGYLNSSTAFLGSIILGNGINYAIIFVARYQEERSRGAGLDTAVERSLAGVLAGTGVAALCSSAAYASLMLTKFRGFSQFGLMGATGVLFCWVATFTVLPALIQAMDSRLASKRQNRAPLELSFLGPLVTRRASALLILSTLVTGFAIVGLRHFLETPFEFDFRKLNTRTKSTDSEEAFDQSKNDLFGRWPSPIVVMADDLSEVEAIKAEVRRKDVERGGQLVFGDIINVYDVLPGPPQVQARKIALIEDIKRLTQDKAIALLDESERKQITDLDLPANPRVLVPTDLPPLARRPFTEIDGSVGRVVLLYPSNKISYYDGRVLLRMAEIMQHIHLPAPLNKTIDASGSPVIFGAMIRSVLRDGPLATAASLLGVIVLALLIMRPASAAFTATFTLVVGVVWMVGAAGWAEVKITFLNFIALPITFGIGAEYALNIVSRHRQNHNVAEAVVSTGSAVAMCSWTTIVGYGSLLAARNRALQGFGAMAILGEVTCLVAALFALPSLLLFLERRKRPKTKTAAAAE